MKDCRLNAFNKMFRLLDKNRQSCCYYRSTSGKNFVNTDKKKLTYFIKYLSVLNEKNQKCKYGLAKEEQMA